MRYTETYWVYVFLLVFVAGEIFYIHEGKKQIKSAEQPGGEEKFYYGRRTNRKDLCSSSSWAEIVFGIIMFCMAVINISALFTGILDYAQIAPNDKWDSFVSAIPGIMLTVLITLITCLGVFAKWVKTEYIVFELRDIFARLPIAEKLKRMSGCTGLVFMFQAADSINFKENGGLSFSQAAIVVCFFAYLFMLFPLIYHFIDILIGNRVEQLMLKNLYQNFSFKEIQKIDVNEDNKNYKMQIQFLLDEYIRLSHTKKIKSIKNIDFDTNLKQSQRNKRLRRRSVMTAVTFLFFWLFLSGIYLIMRNFYIDLCIYISICFVFIVQFVVVGLLNSGLSDVLIIILYGRAGYDISRGKSGRRHAYVGDYVWRKNIFFCYVSTIKSLMAYAVMVHGQQNIQQFFEEECKKRCQEDEDYKLIIELLNYIFNNHQPLQRTAGRKQICGMEVYADEFIRDCFYIHTKSELVSVQEGKTVDKEKVIRKKKSVWYGWRVVAILVIAVVILVLSCVFINNIIWKELSVGLIGALVGGIFTISGVMLTLRSEYERQSDLVRLDRMPLLAFRTYNVSLETLGDSQIFSIAEQGILTSGFPEDECKLYTGIAISLGNGNPAFNVHILDAKIDDGMNRQDYGANNPLEIRLVGNEELEIMICYMAYDKAVQHGCSVNISGVLQVAYEDIFGNQYIQDVPVIFTDDGKCQKMEITTLGQAKYKGRL